MKPSIVHQQSGLVGGTPPMGRGKGLELIFKVPSNQAFLWFVATDEDCSSLMNLNLVDSYFTWHNKWNSTSEKGFSLNHNKDQGKLFLKENWSPYGEQLQLTSVFILCLLECNSTVSGCAGI